jgi:replication factor C large subunit
MGEKNTIPLSEKYRPKKFSDIKGQEIVVDRLRSFVSSFNMGASKKKAMLLHGSAGVGKTTLAHVLASELGYEIFELNASDLRNRLKLEEIMKPSVQQQSLFAKGKIILIDEVDGVTATEYGGLAELILLIEKTKHPVILTCNDVWQHKFSLLRQKCEVVGLKDLTYNIIFDLLVKITKLEGKRTPEDLLKEIAAKSRGDIRAALNDLQSIINIEDFELAREEIHLREKTQSVFNSLKEIFQLRVNSDTLEAYNNVDLEIDQIMLWLEENLPLEYGGEELAKAVNALSRADVFKGRIHRQQYWHFLTYQNFFMTAGIAAAKGDKNLVNRFTKYNPPKRILKIWMANQRNAKKKSIAGKLAELTHTSTKRALRDFSILALITDNKTISSLNLSDQEQEYLIEKKQEEMDEIKTKLKAG